jgi:drug/metabolite transporter (DMT)-like permease
MRIVSSAISGILAASAGVFGKFGFQESEDQWYYKVLSVVVMFILNSLMIKFLVQSYQEIGAAKATAINLAFNYFFSALLGYLIYHEEVSSTWMLGASFMLIGVFIIASEKQAGKLRTD